MSILYFNARSLLHNIDDLRVICNEKKPDPICIVETWLCSDISDNEIAIPDYTIHRWIVIDMEEVSSYTPIAILLPMYCQVITQPTLSLWLIL